MRLFTFPTHLGNVVSLFLVGMRFGFISIEVIILIIFNEFFILEKNLKCVVLYFWFNLGIKAFSFSLTDALIRGQHSKGNQSGSSAQLREGLL